MGSILLNIKWHLTKCLNLHKKTIVALRAQAGARESESEREIAMCAGRLQKGDGVHSLFLFHSKVFMHIMADNNECVWARGASGGCKRARVVVMTLLVCVVCLWLFL